MLRRCPLLRRNVLPLVMDMPFLPPPDPTADVLLSDLQWSTLADSFPGKTHMEVGPGDQPLFKITTVAQRTLGLLPVRTVVARQRSPFRWVPFLIDTGAFQTYFTDATTKALKLDVADHIEIGSVRVNHCESSHHFDDVNLLGTDFLRYCRFCADYPRGVVQLDMVTTPNETVPLTEVWVTELGTSISMPVTPKKPTVAHLKQAIMPRAEPREQARILIKHLKTGATMKDKDALEADTEYGFELPKVPSRE